MKNAKTLLALIIALSIPILSVYFVYLDFADDDPFLVETQYENADVDDLFEVPNCDNQLFFFASIDSNVLLAVFLPEINLMEKVYSFRFFLSSCLEQKNLVLRC